VADFKHGHTDDCEPSPRSNTTRTRGGDLALSELTLLSSEHSWPGWPTIGRPWCARYVIEREIAHGGSAVVFQAEDQKTGAAVAVKVLRPGFGVSEAERFAFEIRVMRQLTHPHIMPICGQGVVGHTQFYVMPYYGRMTLRRLLKRWSFETDDALGILTDLAEAVGHIHGAGFVHRDIKPENVLMRDGRAILTDFGSAGGVNQNAWTRITQSGCCPGTPEYMSPEQFWDTDRVGVRSDVYSLACLAFELLAGHTPHAGGDALGVAGRHLSAPIPRISDVAGLSFRDADAVFARGLAKEPDQRHATAMQFVRELRCALPSASDFAA